MSTKEIRQTIRERTGIDVAPDDRVDLNALLRARLECEKTSKEFAYDMADCLARLLLPYRPHAIIPPGRVLQADPWELAEAMAIAIQQKGRN